MVHYKNNTSITVFAAVCITHHTHTHTHTQGTRTHTYTNTAELDVYTWGAHLRLNFTDTKCQPACTNDAAGAPYITA